MNGRIARRPDSARRALGSTEIAGLLDRLVALTAAGVPAARALRYAVDRDPSLTELGRSLADGLAPIDALARLAGRYPGWTDVALVWAVGDTTGAPTASTMHALARAVRENADTERAVRVALAGPSMSSRVVLTLPVFGIVLGSAWGSGPLQTLFGTVFGWCCLGAASGLVWAGAAWSRRLVRRARPSGQIVGIGLDAWAVALSGGGSWLHAADALAAAGLDGARLSSAEAQSLKNALDLADEAGVPAAGLLRAAAGDLRREAAATGVADAERLGVRLVLPLGSCILPAFVLVGVVPVVVGVLSSTTSAVG